MKGLPLPVLYADRVNIAAVTIATNSPYFVGKLGLGDSVYQFLMTAAVGNEVGHTDDLDSEPMASTSSLSIACIVRPHSITSQITPPGKSGQLAEVNDGFGLPCPHQYPTLLALNGNYVPDAQVISRVADQSMSLLSAPCQPPRCRYDTSV